MQSLGWDTTRGSINSRHTPSGRPSKSVSDDPGQIFVEKAPMHETVLMNTLLATRVYYVWRQGNFIDCIERDQLWMRSFGGGAKG